MKLTSAIFFVFIVANVLANDCNKKIQSKLICYYSKVTDIDSCKCSHVILPANSDIKTIDRLRTHHKGIKFLITVNEFNQGLVNILKSSKVDGIEINLKKLDSKNDIIDFISTVRSKLGSDLYIVLSVPSKAEILAKYYDFKRLSKNADLFILQTSFLGVSNNVTFHPSRLSGLWDMQNTDSVVDLVSGLGAPLSKLIIASPVQAFKFKLQSEKHTAPGSPALEVQSLTRDELCKIMRNGQNWTLERDQDQAGPYIFSKDHWIAFDDPTSIDIKAKYTRVRGLAGMALKDLSQDGGKKCESSILDAAFNGLSRQARAPRGAVLHSLEREIMETPARPLDSIQVSPYRISRVIDVEGKVHVVRQDTRTEFECARQGYYVHPRSCGRFYRCVKFDQLSDEFNVFEFDCPAGLTFDSTVEVCVWPGSLSYASPCSGSSEIAPVPRQRFICPNEPGYYADPENCRWFFACLDHGKSPLSAYEFRCPFGLVFDEARLLCEWPWLVPKCGSGFAVGSEIVYGGTGSVALGQYDGLGILGVTSLGGLHGPLQQPVAKVYSNVGIVGGGVGTVGQGIGFVGQDIGVAGQGFGLAQNADINGQGVGIIGQGAGTTRGQAFGATGQGVGIAGQSVGIVGQHAGIVGQGAGIAGQSIGYQNVFVNGNGAYNGAGYVVDNAGISLKAAQSLQNAGLLRGGYNDASNLVFGSGSVSAIAGDINYGLRIGQNTGSGLVYTQGQDTLANAEYQSNGYGAKSQQNIIQFHGTNGRGNDNSGFNYAVNTGSVTSNLQQNLVNHGSNLNYQAGSSEGIFAGGKSTEFGDNLQFVGGLASVQSGHLGNSNAHLVNGLTHGNQATSQQSILQYHGQGQAVLNEENLAQGAISGSDTAKSTAEYQNNGGSDYDSGTSGNINIVKGGYSAVGIASSGAGITNYENTNSINQVTASPISVSTLSSIPTVTSVPVPALRVASGFQSYKGGVVANVPELQFKVQKPISNVFYEGTLNSDVNIASSRGNIGVANVSSYIANVVSSTPSTIITGYNYPKPTVSFIEEPLRTTIYQKSVPSVSPVVISTTQTPLVQPFITTYQKPSISTNTLAQQVSNVQHYQRPLFVSSTQTPLLVEQAQPVVSTTQTSLVVENVQPVVSAYNIQKEDSFVGYDYPKPSVRFEETSNRATSYQQVDTVHKNAGVAFSQVPLKTVNQAAVSTFAYSTPSTVRPAVVEQVHIQQPIGGSFSYQNLNAIQKNEGYSYEKPAVVFEETPLRTVNQPAVSTFTYSTPSTVKPVILEQPVVTEPAVSYSSTFQKHENYQGYNYQNPQVQLTSYNVPVSTARPQIYVSSTPATVQPNVVSSFSISSQPQVQIQKQLAAVVTHRGGDNSQSDLAITDKPAVVTYQPFTYQAPAVSIYNYKNVVQSSVGQGYSYPKPEIVFEETPASVTRLTSQQPVVYTVSSTVRPVSIVQKQTPVSFTISSTPRPEVLVQQQPTVVTSYSTPSTVKPAVGYSPVSTPKPVVISSYSFSAPSPVKPAPEFEMQPAVAVSYSPSTTPRAPAVLKQQPAVVSSFSYSAPSTVRPTVVLEEQPVVNYVPSSTPRPTVVSSFSYSAPPAVLKKQPAFSYVSLSTPRPAVVSSFSYSAPSTVKPAVVFEEQPIVNYVPSSTPRPAIISSFSFNSASNVNQEERVKERGEFNGYDYPQPVIPFAEEPTPVVTSYENRQPVVEEPIVPKKAYVTGSQSSSYQFNQEFDNFGTVQLEQRPLVVENYGARISSTTPSTIRSGTIQLEQRPFLVENYEAPISSTTAGTIRSGYVYNKPAIQLQEEPVLPIQKVVVSTTPRTIVDYSYVQSTPRPTFASTINAVVSSKIENQPFRYYDSRLSSTPATLTYSTPLSTIQTVTTSRPIARYSFSSLDDQIISSPIPSAKVVENYVAPIEVSTAVPVRTRVTTSSPEETYVVPEVTPSREYLPVTTGRPKTIIKLNDFHPLLPAKLGAQCTCVTSSRRLRKKPLRIIIDEDDDDDGYVVDNGNVENYQYEPKRIVDITPTPEIHVQSSVIPIEPVLVKQRGRVRVTSTAAPVTQAAEVFLTPINRDGLESRNFDRYGPGGLRSRDEKLQGTIDCQRAGLFRHPTQCNKFYACRWDCTKNRYTLHVFNCPVHLTFDNNLGACNWPSQGPACLENTLLPSE